MFKSVFSKYLSIISLVVLVGFLAMTLMQTVLTANALADEKQILLIENAENIARQTALTATATPTPGNAVVYHLDENRLSPLLNLLAEAIDATVLVTNGEGRILLTAGRPDKTFYAGSTALQNVVPKIKEQKQFYEVGTLNGLYSRSHYTAAVPVTVKDQVVLGYVFAIAPADAFAQTVRSNIRIYLLSVLAALLFSMAVVWLMTDRFVRPLRYMAAATRRFAQGDFSARVKVRGKDEVAELGHALNNMAVSLSSVETMRRRRLSWAAYRHSKNIITLKNSIW